MALVFGGYYALAGARVMLQGSTALGGLFLFYGIGGIVLGVALWTAFRDYRRKLRSPEPPGADS